MGYKTGDRVWFTFKPGTNMRGIITDEFVDRFSSTYTIKSIESGEEFLVADLDIVVADTLPEPVVSPPLKGGGLRLNEGKPQIELVPPSAILALAEVLTVGAKKYKLRNWELGMNHSICYASAMRHLLKYWSGEDLDEETGKLHLAHVLTNIAFLVEYQKTCPELDDRPSRGVLTTDNK